MRTVIVIRGALSTDQIRRAIFNGISYVGQKVPSLFTVMSVGKDATKPAVYSKDVNPFILTKDQIVEVIINNDDDGAHPMRMFPWSCRCRAFVMLSVLLTS